MSDDNKAQDQQGQTTPSTTKNLLLRVASALVLAPLALAALYVGNGTFLLGLWLIWALGLDEWVKLTERVPKAGTRIMMQVCFAFLLLAATSQPFKIVWMAIGGFFLLMGEVSGFFSRKEEGFGKSGYLSSAGLVALGGSAVSLIRLRFMPEIGLSVALYVCLIVWGTDIGAYFAGRLIGGPKLAPKLSPKKTWAGLIGGMALAAVCGYGVARFFVWPDPVKPALWALVLAVVAQMGDLTESFLKRRAGVKDSGAVIPGHGGVLDRIDGLLFAALFLDLLVSFFGQTILGLPPFAV